jgi:hypothetical protein
MKVRFTDATASLSSIGSAEAKGIRNEPSTGALRTSELKLGSRLPD